MKSQRYYRRGSSRKSPGLITEEIGNESQKEILEEKRKEFLKQLPNTGEVPKIISKYIYEEVLGGIS